MPKGHKSQSNNRSSLQAKYDAHHVVIDKTYGDWADLRRELSDSRSDKEQRKELLDRFAHCTDAQQTLFLLDDYFERISLSRKDFAGNDWWPRILAARGKSRLEETAMLFLRANRQLPSELMDHTNWERLAKLEQTEQEQELVTGLEQWLLPPKTFHLDAPRASVRVICRVHPITPGAPLHYLTTQLNLTRSRNGRSYRNLGEVTDLIARAAHERELYPSEDWNFILWLVHNYRQADPSMDRIDLQGAELLIWLTQWGNRNRLLHEDAEKPFRFRGRMAELRPRLVRLDKQLCLDLVLQAAEQEALPLTEVNFFAGHPSLVLAGQEFLLLRNRPESELLAKLERQPAIPVQELSSRLREYLPNLVEVTESDREELFKPSPARARKKRNAELETWLLPSGEPPAQKPPAGLEFHCQAAPVEDHSPLLNLIVQCVLPRSRGQNKRIRLGELVGLPQRRRELEKWSDQDQEFIHWLADRHPKLDPRRDSLALQGEDLLHWLIRWGDTGKFKLTSEKGTLNFLGRVIELHPQIKKLDDELCFAHILNLPDGSERPMTDARYFAGQPSIVLLKHEFFLLRNAPDPELLVRLNRQPIIPAAKLSSRILTHLRKEAVGCENHWQELCACHTARPQFIFELINDTIRIRLEAVSDLDGSRWQWNGHEWQKRPKTKKSPTRPAAQTKPELLDDARLDCATQWLRTLDCFTPEPGVWSGDNNENFLTVLAQAWPRRPEQVEYLGNTAFQRLFIAPKKLKPKLVMNGSGIDWLSVSAKWEQEGLQLTEADIKLLQTATGRFVKLPDSGWVELNSAAVQKAQETMAELGIEGLSGETQKVSLIHAVQLPEEALSLFGKNAKTQALREKIKHFTGITPTPLPPSIQAELRPYQQEGFNFLCHLTSLKLGGILADDMGLGKTLQTLCWITHQLESFRQKSSRKRPAPVLVICPASVLQNWRREANKFAPDLKVLLLESGIARHQLRNQIPQHDLTITNYAILRRDFEELQKFQFSAVILDEAQYIKNPAAQVTQSAKQLNANQRLALTGTPLENRLLDLWSIVDFVQPGYLGTQNNFTETYEPKGENAESRRTITRKQLSAKLRPLLLRRLKTQVAQDLPERIDERRDCELTDPQRKLYLAELRRSREQLFETIKQKGASKSKIHVLAALTRLRQICCHPQLVGNDAGSGKTDTLVELLEPLLAEGQKVLLFSQFVQMLQILEKVCRERNFPTHILTGQTKNRMNVVNAFQQDPDASIFLLSLRAAGTGLNLTTASYVVLYDPWWNPAVEAQAIDRSHRIGQTRTVNAYRLISPGTVEEKIWELQQRKARTISDVLGEEGFASNLSASDLEYLFSED